MRRRAELLRKALNYTTVRWKNQSNLTVQPFLPKASHWLPVKGIPTWNLPIM